jgi:Domain of unknown function (DUF4419)
MPDAAIIQSVSDVVRAKRPLLEASAKEAIEALIGLPVEACFEYHGKVVESYYHPFVAAVDAAFCGHRPLELSPDMLWLLVAQGLARHVNANSDALRRQFVQHDGKETITVRRDEFVKGSPENPWSEVLGEFSAQIKKHIGELNHSNIVVAFSTTGPVEKAANEIVMMDTLKRFFKYKCETMCGIPEVKLEGTTEDWHKLSNRTKVLGDTYGLDWWTNRIVPTLERIARNVAGADDPDLWNSIYKIDNESGGPHINGWIVDFFPYLRTTKWVHNEGNELVDNWKEEYADLEHFRTETIEKRNWLFEGEGGDAITINSLPNGFCIAPFKWQCLAHAYDMAFVAGFIGFTQNSLDFAVRPKIGWAVLESRHYE